MKRLLRPLDDESVITATPSAAADSAYGSVELDCSAPELALANAISILADAMDEFNGAVRGGPRANETCGARLERILGTLLDVYVKRVDCGPRNIGAAQLELQKLLPGYLQIAAGLRHEEAYAHIAHIVVRYGRDMGQLRRPCGGRDATFGGVPATEVITRDVARRRFVVMLQRVLRVYTLAG